MLQNTTMFKLNRVPLLAIVLSLIITFVLCENKYTKAANQKKDPKLDLKITHTTEKESKLDLKITHTTEKDSKLDLRTMNQPFRMAKLNILWTKAQQRLTEPKLKSLYNDLMIQDKEEITHKRIKNEGGDKDGLIEAKLRKKLTAIMASFGLREHFEDNAPPPNKYSSHKTEEQINRSLFKDKKLNMLWNKAEKSGFTSEELSALKEEFLHHQDKIEQYYELLYDVEAGDQDKYRNALNDEEMTRFNEISDKEPSEREFLDKANLLRQKHRSLRDGYDNLERLTAKGPTNQEFVEPKVQELWRMATQGNFTADELHSLKVELMHYEARLKKLRKMRLHDVSPSHNHYEKIDDKNSLQQADMIKKQSRKVEKLHDELELRIMQRHSEL